MKSSIPFINPMLPLLALLVCGAPGCGRDAELDITPYVSIEGVPLSEDLGPAVEDARKTFHLTGVTHEYAGDAKKCADLIARIRNRETREEAGQELYTLWRANPEHFVWIDLAWRMKKNQGKITLVDPVVSGKLIVLHTEDTASTVMIISSKRDIYPGDMVN